MVRFAYWCKNIFLAFLKHTIFIAAIMVRMGLEKFLKKHYDLEKSLKIEKL